MTGPTSAGRVRLFCLPYAGSGASTFRAWTRANADSIEVYPVQLPGREERLTEPPFHDLWALVDALTPMLARSVDGPFALLGGSMGALIAFELARSLRRDHGLHPATLFVLACRAPSAPQSQPPLHRLPDAELVEALKGLGGTSKEVFEHPELVELLLPTIRADLAVCETYQYRAEELLQCPIFAYSGVQDHDLPVQEALGWRSETTGRFAVRTFEGDHFFLRTNHAEVYKAIVADLATAAAPERNGVQG